MTDATELGADAEAAVRDLILVLADTKRLLGYRYAEWMLGAPELETGIACSSMAQDEWGHARLLYALMKGFDEDPEALEHAREPAEYRSMEVLDASAGTWPEAVALMALADVAVTTQFEALRSSSYDPIRQRVEKVVEEERFHAAHGAAWFQRLAEGTDASRSALRDAVSDLLPPVLAWFGPDSERAGVLEEAGVAIETGSALRSAFLERVSDRLARVGVEPEDPFFDGFDEARRRGPGGPDEETIRRIRGDRNRAFLMD
ncbi:MAG: Phenylacetic acid catabolic protein [Longimicrobiales bacterium]|nr:Phenylacetic acid catabolic protein [Longimicrobiales bacterium]